MEQRSICPVCKGARLRDLFIFPASPLYLNPVEADANPPPPYTVDLNYQQCLDCGHGFQTGFDFRVLADVYRSYYYTPAPEGIATGSRSEFMIYLTDFARRTSFHPQSVFEVGCSSGEALQEIGQLFSVGKAQLVGCEPNRETAASARERGLVIHETFFDRRMARTIGHFDLVVSRHVIEHVDDVVEFLSGLALLVRKPNGLIVIETPSLDAALANGDTKAFHVEHLHMFSVRSLALAGRQAGLTMLAATNTALGSLIVIFACHGTAINANATDTSSDLQSRHDAFCARWKQRLSGHQAVFWGAGSAARMFLAQTGFRPLAICDTNPGKTGKRYVGLPYLIEYAPRLISRMVVTGEDNQCVLVATSMFHHEIRRAAHELGWRGDFVTIDDLMLGTGYGLR